MFASFPLGIMTISLSYVLIFVDLIPISWITPSYPRQSSSGTSGSREVPGYAKDFLTSDMNGLGPDGKPTNMRATFTGASKANATAEEAMRHEMKLTNEEQAILDGKEGKEKARLMKILVKFGNTFGAEKLVGLGGAPHSNMFIGAGYMASMIRMLDECCKAGLKSYAPYTWRDSSIYFSGYPFSACNENPCDSPSNILKPFSSITILRGQFMFPSSEIA